MFDGVAPLFQLSSGRWRRVTLMSLSAGLLAMAVYTLLICRCAYPGSSASGIAAVAGLDVPMVFTRPLMRTVGAWFAALPLPFGLAIRFNLLAVCCGGFLVAASFATVWFLVTKMMAHPSTREYSPRVARFAAWGTALCMMFSLPIVVASTRFTFEIVDAAALAVLVLLLVRFSYLDHWWEMSLFGIILGFGVAESPHFVLALPVLGFLYAAVEWKNNERRFGTSIFVNTLLGVFAYAADIALSVRLNAKFRDVPFTDAGSSQAVYDYIREQYYAFLGIVPEVGSILIFATGCGLFIAVFFLARWLLSNLRGKSVVIMLLLCSGVAGFSLFNAQGTAWAVTAAAGKVPILSAIFSCLSTGLVLACWRMFATVPPSEGEIVESADGAEQTQAQQEFSGRGLGLAGAWTMVVIMLFAAFFCFGHFSLHDGDFADYAANQVLDNLGEREWILSGDLLDGNLLINAHERKKRIVLMQTTRSKDANYDLFLRREMEGRLTEEVWLRALAMLEHHPLLFLQEVFLSLPDIENRAVAISAADFWYSSKLRPRVEPFCFGGVRLKTDEPFKSVSIPQEKLEASWQPLLKMVKIDDGEKWSCDFSRNSRNAVMRLLSMQVNNRGTELDDIGDVEKAFECYRLARRLNPDNVSALLNLVDLVVHRKVHQEAEPEIKSEFLDVVNDKSRRYPLWALSRYYGYVRNYRVFQGRGLAWAASSNPEMALDTLRHAENLPQNSDKNSQHNIAVALATMYAVGGDFDASLKKYEEMIKRNPRDAAAVSGAARLYFQEGRFNDAYQVLKASKDAGLSEKFTLNEWAVYYYGVGEYDKVRMLLENLDVQKASPSMQALLGMVMLRQDEMLQVENVILPRMRKTLNGTDMYFYHVLQAQLYLKKGGRNNLEQARANLLHALSQRPDVLGPLEMALQADMKLRDAASAELHAIQLLRRNPKAQYANYVMGTFRLNSMKFADACRYFSRIAEGTDSFYEAYNNYADALVRLGDFVKAETAVNRAIEMNPERAEAYVTLADIYVRSGRLADAKRNFTKATSIVPNEPRFDFVAARIAFAEKEMQTYGNAIDNLESLDLTELEKYDLKALRALESGETVPEPGQGS
ncbi:MAG: tetratricopeptide repeat protein [Kiritimatiellae bacterium]|nr:tetratricopeptide repeat protein [Kiritimatiellia bacterium]